MQASLAIIWVIQLWLLGLAYGDFRQIIRWHCQSTRQRLGQRTARGSRRAVRPYVLWLVSGTGQWHSCKTSQV